ncbi:MAG: KTSC domain-containing protein [Candidatus Omnitrophota bacterium]
MVKEMDIKPVQSRDLALIGYDNVTSILEVVFRAGGVYRFQEVPESVYHGLMAAPSHGIFFQKYIKTQYPFVKVN